MGTSEMREHAGYLLKKAEESLAEGKIEEAQRMVEESTQEMAKADQQDATQAQIDALHKDYSESVQKVPVASKDLETYDPNDNGANLKASYKPASWVKGLPAVAQPIWVQEKMGIREKEDADFQRDTFVKWMSAPSQEVFFKNATPDEVKAMQEDTDAEGGYFVPEEFINQVIHDTGLPSGSLRAAATTIRVASKDGYIPTLASASWAAIAEEAAYSDQTPTVGQVAFAIEKSGGLVKVTRELLDDSAINLPSLLTQIFQEASGRFEDVGILNGNNTTNYAGILTGSSADYVMASATALTTADLLGIYYTLEAQHRANATWVMPSLISKTVNSIQSTAAGVTGIADLTSAPASFLLGRPVINNDVSGNGFATTVAANNEIAILGDFRQYYLFDRIGFTIRRNDSLYMENDQVGFFGTRRGDGQVGLAAAFKILKAAAS
tara:strand:+ start:1800 stop:3113 length:1314 start_codon:yes stop_codon:yes gene_type:complete